MDSFNRYLDSLQESISRIPEAFDSLEKVCSLVLGANAVVCTGVGKSGFVAQKISASLRSISLPSEFLCPFQALHGDIGGVRENSTIIIFSKSGESTEILRLVPVFEKKCCSLIVIGNRFSSRLSLNSTIFIGTNVAEEGDSKNTLPLVSTDISLIIGNLLVARCADKMKISTEAFAANHPGGQLGHNLLYSLWDLQSWKARTPFVGKDTSIDELIVIDSKFKGGMVCVLDGACLVGVVTDGDLRRAIKDKKLIHGLTAKDLMNNNPIVVTASMKVGDALKAMENGARKVFSAPVLDDLGECVGLVTLHDLMV